MTLPVEGYQLKGISPKAYEHPADRAATASLQSIPYLDRVVRKLIELGYERALRQACLGSSVRLGEEQLPNVWRLQARAYARSTSSRVPDLYLTQFPRRPTPSTIGAGQPIVVLQSGLVKLLDEEQLYAVLAHEAGHVLSDHVLYGTALTIITAPQPAAGDPAAADAAARRADGVVPLGRAELRPRGGARDARPADRLPRADGDRRRRRGQAPRPRRVHEAGRRSTARAGSGLERLSRLLLDLNVTHPMPVRRIHELMAVGRERRLRPHRRRLLRRRRDEPVRPRAEAGDAVAHYAERFKNVFRDAGESINDVGKQLSDWLRGNGDHDD